MIRAYLMGDEPSQSFGFTYTKETPYEAVMIGSLSFGQLLRFSHEPVLEALAKGLPVYLYTPGLPQGEKNRSLAASCNAAQRELKSWGVIFTDGGRKKLITAEEAKMLLAKGQRPGPGAVMTPLAKEILEGLD